MNVISDYLYDNEDRWDVGFQNDPMKDVDRKTAQTMMQMCRNVTGRAEVGIEGSWGGKEGAEVQFYGNGHVKDRHGNGAGVRVEGDRDAGRYNFYADKHFRGPSNREKK